MKVNEAKPGKSRRHVPYLGRAGQFAVMAELAERGWNVAVPEIDLGDDIIVLDDETGDLRRVQVKTARARETAFGSHVKFKIGLRQLLTPRSPDLIYVLVVRGRMGWEQFLVVSRNVLAREYLRHGVGNRCDRGFGLLVTLLVGAAAEVTASTRSRERHRRDFSTFRCDWERQFPRLDAAA